MGKYTATIGGKKRSLGVDGPDTPENRAKAMEAYRRMKAEYEASLRNPTFQGSFEGSGARIWHLTVSEAVAGYLDFAALRHKAGRLAEDTLANYRFALAPFSDAFGSRVLQEFTSPDGLLAIEAWAASTGWSSSYQHSVLGIVQAVFKRAGLGVKFDRPPMESRGPEVCLTDEQFALVLASLYVRPGAGGDLRELLQLLRETGARPQEVARLRAEEIDWPNCCRLAKEHKTKRKTGKDRLLVFNSAAMAVLEGQRARYRTGLLFRTPKGVHYSRRVICNQLLKVSKRVGFRVVAYGLGRHSFATRALEKGVPDAMVAALLGHSSTQMVHRHYSHLTSKADAMRAAAERVSEPKRP